MGEGASVHNTHVVNTVRPSLPEVLGEKISLLFQIYRSHWWIFGGIPRRLGLFLLHVSALMDELVVAHVQWDEGFACKVIDLIMELVFMSRYESTLITIQGVTYGKIVLQTSQLVGRSGCSMLYRIKNALLHS